jgi:PAS domain S-box-containing protein
MENNKNNIEKESAGISAYIKKILNHEFESLSEISGLANSELAESIISLAAEYRNSLIRTEDYVRSLAEAENKVSRTQKIYGAMLNNSSVGITIVRERRFILVNKKMAELFGYDSPDELTGKLSRICYRSDRDFQEIGRGAYSTVRAGLEYKVEYIAKRKDGSEFWCLLTGKSVDIQEMGNADSVWIFQDIDERKRQESQSSVIVSSLADALFVVNIYKKISSYNFAFLSMFGFNEKNIGDDLPSLFDKTMNALIDKVFLDRDINKRNIYTDEISLSGNRTCKATATSMYLDIENSLSKDDYAADAFMGVVVTVRDITKEKEVDMMKTDFISTVSHELRTPLTSILGFANIISKKFKDVIYPMLVLEDKKTKKTADQIEGNLDIIISEGQRLTSLINDVLDIAKMEAGKIEWKDERFTARYVVEHAVSATSSIFSEKGLGIITEIEDGLPEIFADKDRFIQVVINLLSNAVKFTGKGDITIRAKSSGDFVLISVSDKGMGISKENLTKVFEKFKQVGDTLTDKPKGTGLGLPICKQIVEHYGGKIWAESKEGEGSTFYFTAPRYAEKVGAAHIKDFITQLKNSTPPVLNYDSVSKNILIVDDDEAIRGLLKQELEYSGYVTEEAADGLEALNKIKRKKYDLIILDVMMPGLSGFDVARVLKNNPDTIGIPIIILSVVEDKETGLKIGVERYLIKGVEYPQLLNEVNGLLNGAEK